MIDAEIGLHVTGPLELIYGLHHGGNMSSLSYRSTRKSIFVN